jgi:hypothetical protein
MFMKRFLVLAGLLCVALLASVAFGAEIPPVEGPLIVTTCGQSPGAVMIKMSAMAAGFTAEHNNDLTAADLEGKEYKTLIITTGTSMKGMGAAGTDVKKEVERCTALMEAARQKGMLVIGAHVEGMARRADKADQESIEGIVPHSDMILVVEGSDSDGLFSGYAKDKDLPILIVKDALGIGQGLAGTKP